MLCHCEERSDEAILLQQHTLCHDTEIIKNKRFLNKFCFFENWIPASLKGCQKAFAGTAEEDIANE